MLQGDRDMVEEEYRLVIEQLMSAEKQLDLNLTLHFLLEQHSDECQLLSENKEKTNHSN
jgi:hypothetical protein